jgi:hypothetical protein
MPMNRENVSASTAAMFAFNIPVQRLGRINGELG